MGKQDYTFYGIIKFLRKVIDTVIVIMFLVMFAIVTINVLLRYLFNSPISWSGELSRYSFISIIFFGSIIALKEGTHIGMDFIIQLLPEKVYKKIVLINNLLVLGFLIVFTIAAFRMVMRNTNVFSSAMGIPMSIPYMALPLGGIGMIMELVLQILGLEEPQKNDVEVSI